MWSANCWRGGALWKFSGAKALIFPLLRASGMECGVERNWSGAEFEWSGV